MSDFLGSLSKPDIMTLDRELGVSIDYLHSTLQGVPRERLPESPGNARCLIHGSFHPPEIMWREASGEYIPVGVDWEGSRVGIPTADLAFSVPNLLAKGEDVLFDDFIDTYRSELKEHGVNFERDGISASTRHEAYIRQMSSSIPLVLRTFLRIHDDESYAGWCRWFRQNMPEEMRFMQNEIESGHIYGV